MKARCALLAALGGLLAALLIAPQTSAYKPQPRSKPAQDETASHAVSGTTQESPSKDAAQNAEATERAEANTTELRDKLMDRRYRLSKRHQSEISLFGGDYLGDEWLNNWDVGARYFFHLNNAIALGAEYMYNPIRADDSSVFGQSLKTGFAQTVTAQLMYSNDAAFRTSVKSILECDLLLTVGVGAMEINRIWEWAAVVGGGLKIYTPVPWFAVRFDVNGYLHPTPKPTGDAFNADLVMNLGFSFLFPQRPPDEPKANGVPES